MQNITNVLEWISSDRSFSFTITDHNIKASFAQAGVLVEVLFTVSVQRSI